MLTSREQVEVAIQLKIRLLKCLKKSKQIVKKVFFSFNFFIHKLIWHILIMTKASFITLTVLFGLLSGLAGQSAMLPSQPDVTTVQDLNIQSFMGRWFMMYASKMPLNTYLKDAFCVVQDNKMMTSGLMNGMIGGDATPNEIEFQSVISFK